jgi:hypothetical protein
MVADKPAAGRGFAAGAEHDRGFELGEGRSRKTVFGMRKK